MNKISFKAMLFASSLIVVSSSIMAQDGLINSLKVNASEKSLESFKFTAVINLATTSIKDQGSSGTCWSYATNSFLESEMIRMGKKPVELSQVFTARNAYIEKGKNYVRMHGAVSLGEGGQMHDVINMFKKYGAVPKAVYSGLNYGTAKNKFAEMSGISEAILAAVVKNPNGTLTPNWEKAYAAVIDSYLGQVPQEFSYNGKKYSPQTFAKEVVGILPEEYVEFAAYGDVPPYTKTMMMVPDNWSFDLVYNIKMNDMIAIIDHALKNGYTVGWAADVSEKSFSWKNGLAYIPLKSYDEMSATEKEQMFNGPKQELEITEELRQKAFDNYQTTDDHDMHIVGVAKDQLGKEYYIVKNSWGESNDYKGYIYVSKNYIRYKTTAMLLHRGGVPADILNKIGI